MTDRKLILIAAQIVLAATAMILCPVVPAEAAHGIAGSDRAMTQLNVDLTVCMLERKILDRPPREWIAAFSTECHAEQEAWYRACLRLKAGFSRHECADFLSEEIFRHLTGR
jgi:hypothetical protein